MLTTRIIPCLDVQDGRVVKGVRFQNLREAGPPADLARLYEEQGADEIVFLDISATPEEREIQLDAVAEVRNALSIPLTVGGGVRNVDDAGELLEIGADKVSVNSAAVRDPNLITELAGKFGTQCTVLAVDAARTTRPSLSGKGREKAESSSADEGEGGWQVVIQSGTNRIDLDAVEWAKEGEARGAGEILLTSWDRDGTGEGYDLELIRAVRSVVNVPIIASGGVSKPEHMREAVEAGADAVLAASIFHDGVYTVQTVKSFLAEHGLEMRPA